MFEVNTLVLQVSVWINVFIYQRSAQNDQLWEYTKRRRDEKRKYILFHLVVVKRQTDKCYSTYIILSVVEIHWQRKINKVARTKGIALE